jgi:hypothetical protein
VAITGGGSGGGFVLAEEAEEGRDVTKREEDDYAEDDILQLVRPSRKGTWEPPTPWALADPLFQDLEYPYRHYLSYCKSQ